MIYCAGLLLWEAHGVNSCMNVAQCWEMIYSESLNIFLSVQIWLTSIIYLWNGFKSDLVCHLFSAFWIIHFWLTRISGNCIKAWHIFEGSILHFQSWIWNTKGNRKIKENKWWNKKPYHSLHHVMYTYWISKCITTETHYNGGEKWSAHKSLPVVTFTLQQTHS